MDFTTTEDRQMLADTLRRFLADAWDPETRAEAAYVAPFHLPEVWQGLAEMGVLGAFVGEESGGFGGDGFDIMAVFTEVGRALAPEPLLGALLSLRLLEQVGAGEDLESIVSGEARCVLAFVEPHDVDAATDPRTTARPSDDGWTLSGRKAVVWGGPGADMLLVTAATDAGIGVFAVDPTDAATHDHALIDGGGATEVVFDHTPARMVADDASSALAMALDAGRLALCAEAVGAMDRLFAMTVDHLGARQQFGRPLAVFQALQHRVVDLSIELEQARSITIRAAASLDGPDGPRHVAMAKNLVGRTARLVAEEAIQLHGGIGMTWEYPGSHLAKRLVMLDAQLGDADLHLRRVATGRV